MIRVTFYDQKGWVSLPIIALLLALSTLSVNYQQRWQAAFQWRAQLDEVTQEQKIWIDFFSSMAVNPDFSSAKNSDCLGFCDLMSHHQQKEWQKNGQAIRYRWEHYQSVANESAATNHFYRLCATQNQHQYQCWWWQENRLLSSGWVTASD